MSLLVWAGVAITLGGLWVFVNRNRSIVNKFKNKRIVITGASAGIGAALAQRLASIEGVKVILVARREDKLKQVQVSDIRRTIFFYYLFNSRNKIRNHALKSIPSLFPTLSQLIYLIFNNAKL